MIIAKRVISIVALSLCACAAASASPVFFIVRHAEKATLEGNPELSAAGRERADGLARMLKDAEITAIFTSEFKRTQETAAPTAKATQVTPVVVNATNSSALVEKLRVLKGNALIVGHGNTIPELLKSLGVETTVTIPENDYSELFVVLMSDKPQLVRLHYSL